MNGSFSEQTQVHGGPHMIGEANRSRRAMLGSTVWEGAGGAAAVVLAILALAGVLTQDLMAIAVIAVAVSLLFEGGAIGVRFSRLLTRPGIRRAGYAEFTGGVTAEFMAGAVGIVLGVLSLLNIAPMVLSGTAIVVFGGALLISSGALSRLGYWEMASGPSSEGSDTVAREIADFNAGAQVLTGVGAAILGILALVGNNPMVLTLVALLCLGLTLVMSGSIVGSRISNFLSS
jgi:hypothetical protein